MSGIFFHEWWIWTVKEFHKLKAFLPNYLLLVTLLRSVHSLDLTPAKPWRAVAVTPTSVQMNLKKREIFSFWSWACYLFSFLIWAQCKTVQNLWNCSPFLMHKTFPNKFLIPNVPNCSNQIFLTNSRSCSKSVFPSWCTNLL